jgi:hypothetical protein
LNGAGELVKDWEKIEMLAASGHHPQMKLKAIREGGRLGSGLEGFNSKNKQAIRVLEHASFSGAV